MRRRIEIDFAVPVIISDDQFRRLYDVISDITKANVPEGSVHWVFGYGDKAIFSQADCEFLGKPVDPNAPAKGEPEFDDTVLQFETFCREKY